MNLGIKQLITNFSNFLGEEGIFLIFSALSVLINLVGLIFLYRKNLSVKTRITFGGINFLILSLQCVLLTAGGFSYKLLTLSVFIDLVLLFPFLLHAKKENKNSSELRDFAKNTLELAKPKNSGIDKRIGLDNSLAENQFASQDKWDKLAFPSPINKPKEKEEQDELKKFELDFSHVKNVMAKLNYFNLSASDRAQLNELEQALYYAQNVGYDKKVKEKINEGLGALLKIMAKHGA